MVITRCFATKVPFFMGGRLWNPQVKFSTKDIVYVFIEAENGDVGVGEIWAAHGKPDTVVYLINHDLAPEVVGQECIHIDKLRKRVEALVPMGSLSGLMLNAWSGVDLALWDLRGKFERKPLSQMLELYSDSAYAYASGGLYGKGKGLEELAAEMRGYIAEGFTGVKMKIGGVSLEEDAERVVAVREAIGPDARLMVDALHAYDLPQAMQMADKIHSFDIYWFESPVALEDVAGHGEVNRHSGIPVCGNESLTGLPAFRHLLEHQGATFVHFDLSVCGGISEGMKIAKLAAEAGLTCTLHAASGVQLFSASVNLACSVPNCDSVEYHQVHQWLSDYHPKVMEHEGPQVKPVDGSGLGNTFLTPQFIEEIFRQETVRTSKN